MVDTHTEIAYWSIVKDLVAPVDIPVVLFKEALPEFLASTGSSSRAGEAVARRLNGIAWDWPAWHNFAKKTDRYSVPDIENSVTKMRPKDVLTTLAIPDLKRVCQERQVVLEKKATKEQIVASLIKALGKDAVQELIAPIGQQIYEKATEKCRKQMALHSKRPATTLLTPG